MFCTATDNPTVRGLPLDRKVGVHRLGDYRESNTLAIGRPDSPGGKPIRIEVPRARYTCMRFLVTGSSGPSVLRGMFEYEDGTYTEMQFVCPDWFHDLNLPGPARDHWYLTAVVNGMDRMYGGRYQPTKDPALFDVQLTVSPEKNLVAVILDPAKSEFPKLWTLAHLFALTGVCRTIE